MMKVLLIDDEKMALEYLENIVSWEMYGFEVVGTLTDARQALKVFRKTRPDLVVSDVCMQGMDGLDASEIILKKHPDARIVMISSLAYDDTYERAEAIGVKGFVDKPFHKEQLLKVFEQALS